MEVVMTIPHPPTDPVERTEPVDPSHPTGITRRSALAGAAGVVAATATATATAGASAAVALPRTDRDDDGTVPGATVVAHVERGSHDEVVLYSGDREVVVRDRALVRRLLDGIA
jgi:hypothetical protein